MEYLLKSDLRVDGKFIKAGTVISDSIIPAKEVGSLIEAGVMIVNELPKKVVTSLETQPVSKPIVKEVIKPKPLKKG